MFEAETIDVQLTKFRNFGDIGLSDIIRITEPSGSFLAKGYKDEKDRHEGIMNYIAKGSFVMKDDIAHKVAKGTVFDYISIGDGSKLINAFTSFLEVDESDPK